MLTQRWSLPSPRLGGPQCCLFLCVQCRIAHLPPPINMSLQNREWVSVPGQIIWHQCMPSSEVLKFYFLVCLFVYFQVCANCLCFLDPNCTKTEAFTSHYIFMFPHPPILVRFLNVSLIFFTYALLFLSLPLDDLLYYVLFLLVNPIILH